MDSISNRSVVVVDMTGAVIAIGNVTADVTDGIDDEIVVVDISSDDTVVNANVDNADVVDDSAVVRKSVDEIMFAVLRSSTALVEVT